MSIQESTAMTYFDFHRVLFCCALSITCDIVLTSTPLSMARFNACLRFAKFNFRFAVMDTPFSNRFNSPCPASRVLCTLLRKLKSISTVEDFISLLAIYFAGSRIPEHEALILCVLEQSMEHVRMAQRGHLYFGALV